MFDDALLRENRPFRLFWGADAAATLGNGLRSVALPWFVLQLTGSPLQLGIVFALESAPDALAAPLVGHAIDRRSRRRLLIAALAVEGATVLAIPAAHVAGAVSLPLLYGAMLVLSVTGNLAHNARQAALPTIVGEDRLDEANATVGATRSAVSIAFVLAGGVATALAGAPGVLAGAGVAPLLGAVALVPVGTDMSSGNADRAAEGAIADFLGDVRSGLAAMRDRPLVLKLLALGVGINLLVVPYTSVLLPTLGRTAFGGAAAFTVLLVAYRTGSLAGNAAVGRYDLARRRAIVAGIATVGAAAVGVGLLGRALPPGAPRRGGLAAAVGLLFVAGCGQPFFNVPSSSLLQGAVPDDVRGKVVTFQNSVLEASFPLPLVGAGLLLTVASPFALFLASGVGMVGLAGAAAAWLGPGDG